MTSLIIKGIDEPISPDASAALKHLETNPSSGPFPSDTANNYYSAIKSTRGRDPTKRSRSGRKKKTLSTLVAEALTVSTNPGSPKMEVEPGHIPPVSSFHHDDDAISTGSSITMPTGKFVL